METHEQYASLSDVVYNSAWKNSALLRAAVSHYRKTRVRCELDKPEITESEQKALVI